MSARFLPIFAACVCIAAPSPAWSADKMKAQPKPPTFTVRIQSLESCLNNAKHLASLTGREDRIKRAEDRAKAKLGDKGLAGVDAKRPLGVYGRLAPNVFASTKVFLVPITDEKEFLKTLETLKCKVEKDEDGIYTVAPERAPLLLNMRFANKYAYITVLDKPALAEDQLQDPAVVLPPEGPAGLSLSWNADQVPQELKKIVLNQVERRLGERQKAARPGETQAQHDFRVLVLKEIEQRIESLVNDSQSVNLRVGLDQNAKEVTAEATLTAKPGSKLAGRIAERKKTESVFAGLGDANSAISLSVHRAMPDEMRKTFGALVDDGIKRALAKEKDETRHAALEEFLKAIAPSVKAAELDGGFRLNGPDKDQHYTFLGGLKVQEGKAIDEAVRKLAKVVPEGAKGKINLDAEKVGEIAIHRIDVTLPKEVKARRPLGDHPVYLAITPNAVWLAGGPEGLDAVKEALKAKPVAAPEFRLQAAVSRLTPLMAKGDQEKAKKLAKIAEEAFGKGEGDKVAVSVEGGKEMKARLSMQTGVIKFFAAAKKERAKAEK